MDVRMEFKFVVFLFGSEKLLEESEHIISKHPDRVPVSHN